jgi:hypothetical protein
METPNVSNKKKNRRSNRKNKAKKLAAAAEQTNVIDEVLKDNNTVKSDSTDSNDEKDSFRASSTIKSSTSSIHTNKDIRDTVTKLEHQLIKMKIDSKKRDDKLMTVIKNIERLNSGNSKKPNEDIQSISSDDLTIQSSSSSSLNEFNSTSKDLSKLFNSQTIQKAHKPVIDQVGAKRPQTITPVMYQTQPSYEYIKLEKLSVFSTVEFMDEVYFYENKYKINLPVPSLLSSKIRDMIISLDPSMKLNQINFYNLSTRKLFYRLQNAVKPTDQNQFRKYLEKIDFKIFHNYKPDVTDFKPFYEALLLYRKEFTRMVDFLSADNMNCLPKCNNKEGGLIKIFVSKIDKVGKYGTKLLAGLSTQSYKNLDNFLDSFF